MVFVGVVGVVFGLVNVEVVGYVCFWVVVQCGDWVIVWVEQECINWFFDIVFQLQGLFGDVIGVGVFKVVMYVCGIIDYVVMVDMVELFMLEVVVGICMIFDEFGLFLVVV